jgi:putative tricarboxylic transport membrane protein
MKRDDLLAGSLLALVGIAVVIGAVQLRIGTPLHPQPGFFPLLGGGALTLLAAILLFQAALGRSTGSEAFGKVGPPGIMVAGMCVYVAILEPAGYVPATILISGVILRVLGVRSWRTLGVSSLLLSVGTYVLFARLLGIDLPAGVLGLLG